MFHVAVWEEGEQWPEPLRPVNGRTEDVREQGQDEKSAWHTVPMKSKLVF